jgi:hypothetical protein
MLSIVLIVFAVLLIVATLVIVVLVYKNQEDGSVDSNRQISKTTATITKQQFTDNMNKMFNGWGIETVKSAVSIDYNHFARSQLLHRLVTAETRSTVVSNTPQGIVAKKWTSFPVSDNHRHSFNPTWSPTLGISIVRNDNVHSGWMKSETHNDIFDVKLNPVTAMPEIEPNSGRVVVCKNVDGSLHAVARTRHVSSSKMPTYEDFRFAVGCDKIVTGVQFYVDDTKKCAATAVFEFVDCVLKFVRVLESPKKSQIEKNWIFVKNQYDDDYRIFYDAAPLSFMSYNHDTGDVGALTVVQGFVVPDEWSKYLATLGIVSALRMTSATLVNNDEIMLLFHAKKMDPMLYCYFCMYLDRTTLKIKSYIAQPVMTDVSIRIFFVMNVHATDDYYHVDMGVSDEIGGILTYDRHEWEKLRVS